MALLNKLADGLHSLIYLENYVNDGSPSGFSSVNAPPPECSGGSQNQIELDYLAVNRDLVIERGEWLSAGLPKTYNNKLGIITHPLATEKILEIYNRNDVERCSTILGWMTAGGRTFILDTNPSTHAKLHYPGILGRVRRELPYIKALAGFEVSREIESYIKDGQHGFGLLREFSFRTVKETRSCALEKSWSCLLRSGRPFPERTLEGLLLPAFSLFGNDRLNSNDPSLVFQLWQLSDTEDPIVWVWNSLLQPLVVSYVSLCFDLGVMPEINAQNLLYELGNPIRPILRDMSRVEKLLHVRRHRGRSEKFDSAPYKVLDLDDDPEYAKIRHSFSYDFKLSKYVIDPLLSCICEESNHDLSRARHYVRCQALEILHEDPYILSCFPPDNVSYGHPKTMLTSARPYIGLGHPLFR